jgi:hypothetical protein
MKLEKMTKAKQYRQKWSEIQQTFRGAASGE